MRRALPLSLLQSVCWGWLVSPPAGGGVRVKVLIAIVSGVRDNQLTGYGLVVGLAGDGDKNPAQTLQTVANILQRFGLTVPATTLSAKNVAIVMVTADIPAFKDQAGTRLDVNVASMADAKSLQGGILLQTPLLGADGKVYAVAQGALTLGAVAAGRWRRRRSLRCANQSSYRWKGRSPMARWWNGKFRRRLSTIIIWN